MSTFGRSLDAGDTDDSVVTRCMLLLVYLLLVLKDDVETSARTRQKRKARQQPTPTLTRFGAARQYVLYFRRVPFCIILENLTLILSTKAVADATS